MAIAKITLSASRDIPFNKLVLSQSNVRRVKAGVSIEELADDIARRTLLQSLTVRPMLDAEGADTGMYEVPAGGRRFRALERLVKQKRLAKTAPIPCVVRETGLAEEDSLAENIQRAPLHPLDQFRAFATLREKGQSEEEIAAAFFIGVAVVRQRLRLAMVSLALLEVYAEDGLTLDQLMAFTVSTDHARQEQAYDRLKSGYNREPYAIRRMLTESTVRASDRRALFVGLDAYVEAGGTITRDLFQADDGGWLQDATLLDRLVATKLDAAVEAVRAEGWHWIEAAVDLPYGHTYGLRPLRGEPVALTIDEESARDALHAEQQVLERQFEGGSDLTEEADRRLGEIEAALAAYDERAPQFNPNEVARAGAFVSVNVSGRLRIERGFVRPEDEPTIEETAQPDAVAADRHDAEAVPATASAPVTTSPDTPTVPEPDEDEGMRPISDRLMTELTAHRTLALRHALGEQPDVAFLAALHALCLKAFFRYAPDTCLELDFKQVGFSAQPPGLGDSAAAVALEARHQAWAAALPQDPAAVWKVLQNFDRDSRDMLFAHCVALSVNGMFETYNRRPRALAHADRLAEATQLDMVAAGWVPTVETFFGRVTKARIVEAVREGRGEQAADSIAHMRKSTMAEEAETLLAGSGWLPGPLLTPGLRSAPGDLAAPAASTPNQGEPVETSDGQHDGVGDEGENQDQDQDQDALHVPYPVAAE